MNTNIRLMDEIERNMEVGENFYSLAVKLPLNSAVNLLMEGYSFIEAFDKQEDVINIICAEQDYLSLNKHPVDIYFRLKKLEVNLVKKVMKYLQKGTEFSLKDLGITTNHNTEIDKKLIENFSLFKNDLKENSSRWMMKCLAFKQFRNTVRKEYSITHHEMADKVALLNKSLF